MIVKWRLKNFKSVYEKTELEMKPLTVFAGANSSGKSTFIQSMLLVAQTLTNQVYSRPVILNGHIIRLGSFNDIASSGGTDDRISIGFSFYPPRRYYHLQKGRGGPSFQRQILFRRQHPRGVSIDCDFAFSTTSESIDKKILQLQPELSYSRISCTSHRSETPVCVEVQRENRFAKIVENKLSNKLKDLPPEVASTLDFKVITPQKYPLTIRDRYFFEGPQKGSIIGCSFSHFLPVTLSVLHDAVEDHALQIVEVFKRGRQWSVSDVSFSEEDESFLNERFLERLFEVLTKYTQKLPDSYNEKRVESINRVEQQLHKKIEAEKLRRLCRLIEPSDLQELVMNQTKELVKLSIGDKQHEPAIASVRLPREIDEARQFIREFFSEFFRYLGPLRDEPKAVYPIHGAVDPSDVGLKGEFTAGVLDLHKETKVSYIPSTRFVKEIDEWEEKESTLGDSVLDWLKYMGVVQQVQTQDLGIYGHELKVGTDLGGALHNLMHVGVGVSQVLPILVMSLMAEPSSVLIFEQPEIHLHPRVQARLGDFLLSLAMLGKQCIVETHSEYLINRLRWRAAVDKENKVSDRMGIYFVEKHEGRSEYRKIEVNEYGAIVDWPEGFFDQSQEDSEKILRAAMEKKRRKKKKDSNG